MHCRRNYDICRRLVFVLFLCAALCCAVLHAWYLIIAIASQHARREIISLVHEFICVRNNKGQCQVHWKSRIYPMTTMGVWDEKFSKTSATWHWIYFTRAFNISVFAEWMHLNAFPFRPGLDAKFHKFERMPNLQLKSALRRAHFTLFKWSENFKCVCAHAHAHVQHWLSVF